MIEPAEPPLEGSDLAEEFRKRAGALRSVFTDFFRFLPIVFYFFVYWTPKEYLRHAVRIGALSFLSVSGVLLWVEVAVEVSKGEVIRLFAPATPMLK